MAPIDISETPPSSPTCSPPRKKAKFSLRLKGKSKSKKEHEENYGQTDHNHKNENYYSIFRSPSQESDDLMDIEPVLPSIAIAGLLNRGNICYANAVLQVLRRCPGFEQFVSQLAKDLKRLEKVCKIDKSMESLVIHLSKLLSEMLVYEDDYLNMRENCNHLRNKGPSSLVLAVEPTDFMASFRDLYPSFECNLQHDAQEFLCSLIMALQESANEIKKHCNNKPLPSLSNTPTIKNCHLNPVLEYSLFIKQLFQGKLVHETKCLSCEQSKLRYEDIQEVSVPVVEDQPYLDARKKLMLSPTPKKNKFDPHTLQWAISQFASSECLKGDNKYFCEDCNTYCEAKISTCFEELPRVLTVHLKRFTSSIGFASKITSNLQTPLALSMQEWCSNKCLSKDSVYELFGIVLHSGLTSGSGHYETYIRIPTNEQLKHNELMVNGNTKIPISADLDNNNLETISNRCEEDVKNNYFTASVICNSTPKNNDAPELNSNHKHAAQSKDLVTIEESGKGKKMTIKSGQIMDKCVAPRNDFDIRNNKYSNAVNNTKGNEIQQMSGETNEVQEVDNNQNCDSKTDGNLHHRDGPIRAQRNLRARKTKKSSCTFQVDESSNGSTVLEESLTQQENNNASQHNTSPVKSHGKASCISLITKYFQKSKKQSSDNAKTEKFKHEVDENGKKRGESVLMMMIDDEVKKPSHMKVNRTIEESFKRASCNKSSTIRKLDFVCDSSEKRGNKELDGKLEEDNLVSGNNRNCSGNPERLTKEWIHFDDCTVVSIVEKDILDLLSASESSFMSPYLLFYQKSDIIL